LTSSDGASFKTMRFRVYSRGRAEALQILKYSTAGGAAILAVKSDG
jgi:hypothetical protein